MAWFEIPTDARAPYTSQVTTLDGTPYIFNLDWSPRSASWYLSLYLQTNGDPVPVRTGMRLTVGWPLLVGCTNANRPPGELITIALDGKGDPAYEDLGARVRLYYRTED